VIDINPFGPITNACLFTWEREFSLLNNTQGKVEFKIIEKLPSSFSHLKWAYEDLLDLIPGDEENQETEHSSGYFRTILLLMIPLSISFIFLYKYKRRS